MKLRARHSTRTQDTAVRGAPRPTLSRSFALGALGALAATAALLGRPAEASACGACYASSSESTVVNDHRMAFSIGKQQTILWDSITYSGNPKDFAYVLPAKPGTRLEPSNEAWFTALDAATRPIIMGPQNTSNGGPTEADWEDNGGCSSADSALSFGASDRAGNPVEVVDQATVGPYESVTVRSQDPDALNTWLREHGYAIPQISDPIIASYVKEGFDFIALRLSPGKDARSMEPIRIVSPGTDTSLPLRLMQIGAGANVAITLYVIGEGRYRTANFPDVAVDFGKLFWDGAQNRSNYQELSKATMATENGRAFITEYADHPNLDPSYAGNAGFMSNPGLAYSYKQSCGAKPNNGTPLPPPPTTTKDAGKDVNADAGESDGGDNDGGDVDAGGQNGQGGQEQDAAPPRVVETKCDDLDVATQGMRASDVWVTRLRANLPNAALADTLRLEPAPKQEKVDNIHQTTQPGTIPPARIARMRASHRHGTYAVIGLTAFVVARVLRRKRKGGAR